MQQIKAEPSKSMTQIPNTSTDSGALAEKAVRLRYWQHLLNEALKAKAFTIPVHLGFGYEAFAVALDAIMTNDDQLALTHRNATYNLLRAGALDPVVAEYRGEPSGLAGGHGGSMNLANPERGIAYTSSILGNALPVGAGLAMSRCHPDAPGVVFAFTGDGAMEEGGFWESLVFARSHDLPLAIVVENNDHSMSSTIDQRRCGIALNKLCESLDVTYLALDGNDIVSYAENLRALRDDVEASRRPAVIEVHIALMNQHAGPTPGWPTDPLSIELAAGLVIRDDASDPIAVLRDNIGTAAFDKLADTVYAEGWKV
jgi:TPP-dependent pyruvate/acetoin dehydrogenase alpha subunit